MTGAMNDAIESHWQQLWAPDEVRVFWYVLPPVEVHAAVLAVQQSVADPTVFAAMPLEWLHITLLTTTAPVGEADELLARARAAVGRFQSFVVIPRIAVWRESVVCESPAADQSGAWGELQAAIADASEPFSRRSSRFVPHMTVAYAHGDGVAGAVRERLAAIAAPPPWMVDRVSLVAVRQHPGPARGWYDWTLLGEVGLGAV